MRGLSAAPGGNAWTGLSLLTFIQQKLKAKAASTATDLEVVLKEQLSSAKELPAVEVVLGNGDLLALDRGERWSGASTAGGHGVKNTITEKAQAVLLNRELKPAVKVPSSQAVEDTGYFARAQPIRPDQHDVLAMFKVGISDELNLSEAIIVTRCRKAVRRCNNPQSEIYAFGGLEEHTEAKRLRRVRFIPKFQCPTLMATSPRMQFRIFAEAVTRISLANRRKLSDKS